MDRIPHSTRYGEGATRQVTGIQSRMWQCFSGVNALVDSQPVRQIGLHLVYLYWTGLKLK